MLRFMPEQPRGIGARNKRLPVVERARRDADDPRLTNDGEIRFRDPPRPDTASQRAAIARALVSAPRLPVDLPSLQMTLVDVQVDRRGIDLVLGKPDPLARLRVEWPEGAEAATVEAIELARGRVHPPDRRLLDVACERVRRATKKERWAEARRLADALARIPHDVPMSFLRQFVAGVQATGIVRFGFQCNQNCGICWQGRDWGNQSPETVLAWIEDLHAAGARALLLSGGEPMLDARLPDYVARAKELGFRDITLETNAVLAERDNLAVRLHEAGLTAAFVSLHSGDAATSDAITRAPGTHARTVRGIRALLSAGVAVKLNTVLTAEGLERVAELPDFVHAEFGGPRGLPPLMLSYPSTPYDASLAPTILPDPIRLRAALRATIERAQALQLRLEGLDGPCGPPLCAFDAAAYARAPEGEQRAESEVPFRRHVPTCEPCGVRRSCFGPHEGQLSRFGESSVTPVIADPTGS